jgi:hypothetical protein
VTRVERTTELNVGRYKSSRRNMRARDTCLILSIAYQHCVGVSCRLDTRVWKSSLLHAGALAWSARDRIAAPREDTLCRSGVVIRSARFRDGFMAKNEPGMPVTCHGRVSNWLLACVERSSQAKAAKCCIDLFLSYLSSPSKIIFDVAPLSAARFT